MPITDSPDVPSRSMNFDAVRTIFPPVEDTPLPLLSVMEELLKTLTLPVLFRVGSVSAALL